MLSAFGGFELESPYVAPVRRASDGRLSGECYVVFASMEEAARASLMPLALAPIYLKRMERRDYEPFRTLVTAPMWRRLHALWAFSRRL